MIIYVCDFKQFEDIECDHEFIEDFHGVRDWNEDIQTIKPSLRWWNNLDANNQYILKNGQILHRGDIFHITHYWPTRNNLGFTVDGKITLQLYIVLKNDVIFTRNGDNIPDDLAKKIGIPGNYTVITPDPIHGIPNDRFTPSIFGNDIIYNGITAKDYTNAWDVACPNVGEMTEKPWKFNTLGVTNEYISFQWKDSYNTVGEFSLTTVISDENLLLFKPGRYLLVQDSPKAMIIEKVVTNAALKENGYIMQISGRSLESILDRRVAFPGKGLNTNLYKSSGGLRKAITDLLYGYFIEPMQVAAKDTATNLISYYYPERKIEFLEINPESTNMEELYSIKRPFNAGVNKNVSKEDLLTIISELCRKNNLGFALVPSHRFGGRAMQWEFFTYTGRDKSYYRQDKQSPVLVFSPYSGNVTSLSTTKDHTNEKNVVFCCKEKDAETYIDLSSMESNDSEQTETGSINFLGDVGNWIVNKLKDAFNSAGISQQGNNYSDAAISILAWAAKDNTQGYDTTVISIKSGSTELNNFQDVVDTALNGSALTVRYKLNSPISDITDSGGTPVTTYKKESEFSTGDYRQFLDSTAYGWLSTAILNYANKLVETITNSDIAKSRIRQILSSMDAYTSTYTLTKWLCEVYSSGTKAGLDRKEVCVDEEQTDDSDWTNSKMISFMNSTELVTETDESEETDEEIKKRLKETARKKLSEYTYQHSIDAKCDIQDMDYNVDYQLGDLVQVDDDYGESEQYIIDSVVISDDTTSGYQVIPSFSRYSEIPDAYKRLEWLQIANMKLPYEYNPIAEAYSDQFDGKYSTVDCGPDPKDITVGGHLYPSANNYINNILISRKFTWTEIELIAKKSEYTDISNKPFCIISACGLLRENDGEITNQDIPLMICDTPISPIDFGIPHNLVEKGESGYHRYMPGSGRQYVCLFNDTKSFEYGHYTYYPGISFIYFAKTEKKQIGQYMYDGIPVRPLIPDPTAYCPTRGMPRQDSDVILSTDVSNDFVTFDINKPTYYIGSNELDDQIWDSRNENGRKRLFSETIITKGDSKNIIGQYPQFDHWYNISWATGGSWNYRQGVCSVPLYDSRGKDYQRSHTDDYMHGRFLNSTVSVGSGSSWFFRCGMAPELFDKISEFEDYKKISGRNIYLGGYYNLNSDNIIDENSNYSDTQHGLIIKEFKLYEFNASSREYSYNGQIGFSSPSNIDDVNYSDYGQYIASSPGSYSDNTRFIVLDEDSKRLAHHLIPVRYDDVSENTDIPDEEKYGFYDTVDGEFIPINYGGTGIFIAAGGEISRN